MADELVEVFDRFDLSNKESSRIILDGVDEGIVELGANLFQFNFSDVMDMEKVLNGRPYTIDNQLLNIKLWVEGIDRQMEAFQLTHIWVQLWNLPIHWLTKEIEIKIGGTFEDLEDIIIPMGGSKEGRHMKLKVVVNTGCPLLRGTVVKLNGQSIWVDFRYEKCPNFCYGCGLIGHSDKSCSLKSGTTK
ncbi:uncharacterized protein [Coffea arabica]|uniref:CCHC-type domain-containing protein n=1 Tax=Coffea arabica TaxID=13443 RepID=A0ABM4U633_COFAR